MHAWFLWRIQRKRERPTHQVLGVSIDVAGQRQDRTRRGHLRGTRFHFGARTAKSDVVKGQLGDRKGATDSARGRLCFCFCFWKGVGQQTNEHTVPSIAASSKPHSFTTRRLVTALACPVGVSRLGRCCGNEGVGRLRWEAGMARASQLPSLERSVRTQG